MTKLTGTHRLRIGVLLALPLLAGLTGCSAFENIQLIQDDSVQITAPENLSSVGLPFDVTWTVDGAADQDVRYGVFLDRYPMPPGEGLRNIVDALPQCRGTDTCLEPGYLAQAFGIHITDGDSVTVTSLPSSTMTADGAHFATIVLLDADGNRVGESVWYTSFQVTS